MHLVSEEIDNYCLAKSTKPSSVCLELQDYTVKNVTGSQMLSGPLVASFMGSLIRVRGVKRILEVGTFTGYSALAMAENLPQDGEIITLELSPDSLKIAESFWKKSSHGSKIKSVLGPALANLKELGGSFDLIFIDADKGNYVNYLEAALKLLAPRGIIILDNCLWSGKVVNQSNADDQTKSLQALNDRVAADPDLYTTLVPLRDGLMLVQKA